MNIKLAGVAAGAESVPWPTMLGEVNIPGELCPPAADWNGGGIRALAGREGGHDQGNGVWLGWPESERFPACWFALSEVYTVPRSQETVPP